MSKLEERIKQFSELEKNQSQPKTVEDFKEKYYQARNDFLNKVKEYRLVKLFNRWIDWSKQESLTNDWIDFLTDVCGEGIVKEWEVYQLSKESKDFVGAVKTVYGSLEEYVIYGSGLRSSGRIIREWTENENWLGNKKLNFAEKMLLKPIYKRLAGSLEQTGQKIVDSFDYLDL